MAYVQATINSTDPVNSEAVSTGASRIRDLAAAVKERLASAFVDVNADPMVLKPASLPAVVAGWSVGGGFTVSSGNLAVSAGTMTASGNIVSSGGQFNGSGAGLTSLPAAQLTGTLPALNAASLTALNASNLASGTVAVARLPTTYTSLAITGITAIQSLAGAGGSAACQVYLDPNAVGLGVFAQFGAGLTCITNTAPTATTTRYLRVLENGTEYRIKMESAA